MTLTAAEYAERGRLLDTIAQNFGFGWTDDFVAEVVVETADFEQSAFVGGVRLLLRQTARPWSVIGAIREACVEARKQRNLADSAKPKELPERPATREEIAAIRRGRSWTSALRGVPPRPDVGRARANALRLAHGITPDVEARLRESANNAREGGS